MNTHYLFSSPDGDISLGANDLARPFLITPSEAHPFLTLGDYFQAIKTFLLKNHANQLITVLSGTIGKDISLDDIQELWIRSEKHGAFYHVASVEILAAGQRIRLTVNTAVSEKGRQWLTREYETIKHLNDSFGLPYLPKVFFKGNVEYQADNNRHETLVLFLAEWFDDYHEWHLSIDQADKKQKPCIWDLQKGNRYASEEEAYDIFRQASRILTLYYDPIGCNQIYPWHHGAGDFILRFSDGNIHVKLTTARKYVSIMAHFSDETVNPMIAIIYFFLNLTIRMRLDKLDGVGETVWAGDLAVDAAAEGFFEALGTMEIEGRYHLGQVEDLRSLIKSFDEHELERLFNSLLSLYQEDDPADLAVIKANLKSHIRRLYIVFHGFHL